jgi:hypothetical protein
MNHKPIAHQLAEQFTAAYKQGLLEDLEIRRGVTVTNKPLVYAIGIKLDHTTPTHIVETLTQYLEAKDCIVIHHVEDGTIIIQMSPQSNRI